MARNQTIPSLRDLLYLAKDNNIRVLFDLYSPDTENDTECVVETILDSGINQSLVGVVFVSVIKFCVHNLPIASFLFI